jgi:hypothetical protein
MRPSIACAVLLLATVQVPLGAQPVAPNDSSVESSMALQTNSVVSRPVALTRMHVTGADVELPAPAPVPAGFAGSGFAQFMASPAGRVLRVVAGAGMIAGGIAMDSDGGTILAIAGGIPLSAGLFDVCYLSPLFGGPFKGRDIRAAKKN